MNENMTAIITSNENTECVFRTREGLYSHSTIPSCTKWLLIDDFKKIWCAYLCVCVFLHSVTSFVQLEELNFRFPWHTHTIAPRTHFPSLHTLLMLVFSLLLGYDARPVGADVEVHGEGPRGSPWARSIHWSLAGWRQFAAEAALERAVVTGSTETNF